MATEFTRDDLEKLDKDTVVLLFLNLQEQLKANTLQLTKLTEQVALMNQRTFGRKTESSQLTGQMSLADIPDFENVFNEAEVHADDSPEPSVTEVIISGYTRKKRTSREEDLEELPARILDHTIPEDELAELFPNGYKELPPEIFKRLSVIPRTFLVDEHHVHVYVSKDNDGTIVRADRPASLFRNSIATPSLVSLVIMNKYGNHLPIERLAAQFSANGVNLRSNTLSNWVIAATDQYLTLVYDRLKEELLSGKVIHADETPFRVTRDDRGPGSESRMWVYRSGNLSSQHDISLYDYTQTRGTQHPLEYLKNFNGTLVTDGYQAYHTLQKKRKGLQVSGCWVHAKRKFSEIVKAGTSGKTVCAKAVQKIALIFHEDNKLNSLSRSEREMKRISVVEPLVDDFFSWARSILPAVPSGGNTAKAINYCLNQEQYLRVFLHDGDIPMDNNRAEQAIRPFTLGRKNWVNMNSPRGAQASAVCYSLAETAKANDLLIYEYINLLLTEIPKHQDDTDLSFLDELMPWSPLVQEKCHRRNKTR